MRIVSILFALVFFSMSAFASVSVSVNGSTHTIPQTNEKGWGTNVTAWIQAISQYTLQPSGGTFTLTADVDTGATYGFKTAYHTTQTANPSTTGVLRLARANTIGWRNQANGADLPLGVDSSNRLTFNSVILPTATSASVQDSTFTIYDNVDSTKLLAFQVSGITTGTTRTITVPDSSGTLVYSGAIANADIVAAAAITVNKLAALTASRAAVTDGSGFLAAATTTSTEIGYVNGVTSAIQTQMDLKAPKAAPTFSGTITTPLTASRAMVTGASNELAVSAVTATELGYVSGVTSAIQTQLASATTSTTNSYKISNCSLTATVGSNNLTIALKDAAGSDPSGGSPCTIGFRNVTPTTGTYADVSATAATSFVVTDTNSIGCAVSVACTIYVYAINNGGAVELAAIYGALLDEGSVQSSTTIGSTTGTLYSTSARASKPVRLLGRVTITPAASFHWSNAAAEVSSVPFIADHWIVDANISGANLDLGASNQASYIAPNNSGLTLTKQSWSQDVGVSCSSTNDNTVGSTTCSGGNEEAGIVVNVPRIGIYEVCFDFSHSINNAAASTVNAAFEVVRTTNGSQTIASEGNSRVNSANTTVNVSIAHPSHVCGVFSVTTIAKHTFRLMYEQVIASTPTGNVLLADASSSVGQRDIHVTMRMW